MAKRVMKATEFKAKCLEALDDVARTGDIITITKRGKPVAYLVRTPPRTKKRSALGYMEGTGEIVGDIISPIMPAKDWDMNR